MYRDGAKQGPQVFVFSHTLDTEVLVTVLAQAHPGGVGAGGKFWSWKPDEQQLCPPETTTLGQDY